jgi:hypothetical protein
MICVFPFQTSVGTIRRLRISVPLIECLIDGVRYFRPDDLPPASGEELRPILRPRITVRPTPSSPEPAMWRGSPLPPKVTVRRG